jgi:hypothetical protein
MKTSNLNCVAGIYFQVSSIQPARLCSPLDPPQHYRRRLRCEARWRHGFTQAVHNRGATRLQGQPGGRLLRIFGGHHERDGEAVSASGQAQVSVQGGCHQPILSAHFCIGIPHSSVQFRLYTPFRSVPFRFIDLVGYRWAGGS